MPHETAFVKSWALKIQTTIKLKMYGHIPFKYIETVFGHSFRWINPHNTRFIITENVYGFIILHSFFMQHNFQLGIWMMPLPPFMQRIFTVPADSGNGFHVTHVVEISFLFLPLPSSIRPKFIRVGKHGYIITKDQLTGNCWGNSKDVEKTPIKLNFDNFWTKTWFWKRIEQIQSIQLVSYRIRGKESFALKQSQVATKSIAMWIVNTVANCSLTHTLILFGWFPDHC